MQKKKGRRPGVGRVLGMLAVLLVVLVGGAYAAGYALAGEKLPRRTTVAGIEVGGLDRQAAVDRLREQLGPRANAPLTVVVEGQRHEVVPDQAGLSVDYERTIEQAGAGKSWKPTHIWSVLTGGRPVDPVVVVDQPALDRTTQEIARAVDRPAKDATVAVRGVEIARTDGEQAVTLRQPDVATGLESAYLKRSEVPVPVTRTDPQITTAEADEVVEKWVKPTLSGPVKIDTGRGVFEVTPAMIGSATSVAARDGKLAGEVNVDKLYEAAKPAVKKLDLKAAKDASYKMDGGHLVVVPAVDGSEVPKEGFGKAVLPVLTQTEGREAKVELAGAKAKFSTEDAEKQMPKQVIGEFTTSFPHADYRNTNLGIAASRINGNTVPKDAKFSLDAALGSRTSSGYVDGWVVAGSKLKKENAGGVSQSATTLYNAAWFAGLNILEHQPHTLYFDRYPAGRESTIYSGSIDVLLLNDSDNAIYLEASRAPSSPNGKGSITVKIWGTKKWDIESPDPVKSNFYNGKTITDDSADCAPQAASPGFTATYYRLFKQNGAVVRRQDEKWQYDATDEIRCTKG